MQSAHVIRISPVLHMCVYVCVYVCLVLWNFIICVALCIHHQSQDTEQFQHHKDPSSDLL